MEKNCDNNKLNEEHVFLFHKNPNPNQEDIDSPRLHNDNNNDGKYIIIICPVNKKTINIIFNFKVQKTKSFLRLSKDRRYE